MQSHLYIEPLSSTSPHPLLHPPLYSKHLFIDFYLSFHPSYPSPRAFRVNDTDRCSRHPFSKLSHTINSSCTQQFVVPLIYLAMSLKLSLSLSLSLRPSLINPLKRCVVPFHQVHHIPDQRCGLNK